MDMMIAVEANEVAVAQENGRVPCDKARILVVDDETSIVKLFKMLLEFDLPGRQIDTACNGAEAVEKFASGHHRVLIMDLHMPVMDGLRAFLSIENACRERRWEIHCLLQKPVTSEVLVQTVASRLGS